MALTQVQIIQSLAEAMNWLERELNWEIPPTELRHLIGRIGELYAALITNGQLASKVNQRGYDVISKDGEKISVKTTAKQTPGGHIAFNPNTLSLCNRIMILFFNQEEMQIEVLFDGTVEDAEKLMTGSNGKRNISTSKLRSTRNSIPLDKQVVIRTGIYSGYKISELESGTILIEKNGNRIVPVKPILRDICKEMGISLVNGNGNAYNTRQLGNLALKMIEQITPADG